MASPPPAQLLHLPSAPPPRLPSLEPPRLPYRGTFGAPRPPGLPPLPPQPLASHLGVNPLKAWRWVGCFGPELMLCVGRVRLGRFHQGFYAVYDRRTGRIHERTGGRAHVELGPGRVRVIDRDVQIDLGFTETAGIETVTATPPPDRSSRAYAWTRKQAPIPCHGRVMLGGEPRAIDGLAIIDDSAGYHARHTRWRWCAGVGTAAAGQPLAWNLVEGIHDSATDSERTLWVDGVATELPATPIAEDLSAAGSLSFHAEAARARDENRILVRSRYRQPFGTFSGEVGGIELSAGYGVMEEHDALW